MTCLTQSPAWLALEAHQALLAKQSLNALFQHDTRRFESFSLQFENMLVDFSKQLITQDTIELLLTLARQQGLESWIKKMLRGEKINNTEQRAALHMALRSDTPVILDGEDVTQKAGAVLNQMARFTNAVHSGEYTGYSGKPITDIVNIGIGGSDLGPYMVTDALKPYACKQLKIHFVSDIDGSQIYETLNQLDAATTLFIVASKTFTSRETLTNAHTARHWFVEQSGDETQVARHFIAVTANRDEAAKFGVKAENLFEFWDWVGGRYSVWSAIGLPVALSVGMDHFRVLLAGANIMDRHFTSAPLAQNIPVLLGLIAVWQINFLNVSSHVVLPYDQYLHRFPAYLQQLEMESNGKRITRDGETVDYRTGVVVWGEAGTNGQHAFFQLLHQGTETYSADFLVPCQNQHPMGEHHHWLLANFIAQTQALMRGQSAQEAQQELARQNISFERQAQLLPHKIHPGNHFTTSILFEKLDPKTLGMLLAMYEHKVFVQSVIWNINPFDQWGVELGKQLAKKILPELTPAKTEPTTALDASSNGLINFIKRHSGQSDR